MTSPTPQPTCGPVKRVLKGLGLVVGFVVVSLPALSCKVEGILSGGDELFQFWAHVWALTPGLPGKYLRKCFYRMTLAACSLSCDLGFMSHFTDRNARVGERVYVGVRASIGLASLGEGCLIGSRASILSGAHQHRFGADGRLTPFDPSTARRIHVGEETWIGEAAVLMADVGSRCIVAAGSVVSTPVPDERIVGGNPARFVGRVPLPNGFVPGEVRGTGSPIPPSPSPPGSTEKHVPQ